MKTAILQTLFIACAFLSQILLIFNFATFKWKPRIQQKWGWIIYAHFKPKALVVR